MIFAVCLAVFGHCSAQGNVWMREEPGTFCLRYNFDDKLVLPVGEEAADRYELAFSTHHPLRKTYVQEWIPKDQSIEKWDEMITIGMNRDKPMNSDLWYSRMVKMGRTVYYGSEYNLETLYKTPSEIVLFIEVPNGHKGHPPFTQIMHHFFTRTGYQYVTYEKRYRTLTDHEKEVWTSRIRNAYIRRKDDLAKISTDGQ